MIPVLQTKFHTEQVNGNCLAAAIASILEIPIALVPQFEECFAGNPAKWRLAMTRFVAGHGFIIEEYDEDPLLPEPYLATGRSPRCTKDAEFNHIVVYQSGKLLHDPHPSGEGVLDPFYFSSYRAIEWRNLKEWDANYLELIQKLSVD